MHIFHIKVVIFILQIKLTNFIIISATCQNECGSGGDCSDKGICVCKSGFTGEKCENVQLDFLGQIVKNANARMLTKMFAMTDWQELVSVDAKISKNSEVVFVKKDLSRSVNNVIFTSG